MTSRIKFLLLLCLGLWTLDFGPWTCRAGNAVITLLDAFQNPITNTRCVLNYYSSPQSVNGGTVVQWRTTGCTDGTGTITLTNAAAGNWGVQTLDGNLVNFTFLMPSTNGIVYANLTATAQPGNTSPANAVSYSTSASDLRYDPAGAAAATLQTATNSFDPLGAAAAAQAASDPLGSAQAATNTLRPEALAYAGILQFYNPTLHTIFFPPNPSRGGSTQQIWENSCTTNQVPSAATAGVASNLTAAAALILTNGLAPTNSPFALTAASFNGVHTGNGVGLTNVPGPFPEADAFWTNGTVQTPFTKYRLEGFENELKISGLWTNFVDAVIESPQLFGSNSTTFFGRSLSVSNLVVSGQWGAYFNGTNSTIRVYGLGGLGLRTNTLVTVTRQNWTNAQTVGTSGGSMMLSGLFNTNTGSGDYFVPEWNATLNGVWLMQERATNLWANSQSNLVMALHNGTAADQLTLGVWGGNRSVFCMQHDGIGGQQVWYNGVAGKLNYYTPQTRYSALYTNVDDLNCLSIGYDITNAFVSNYGGFGGQVQAVLIFNTTITTAQAQSIQRITQWLDPATTVEFDLADSRTAPTPWRFEWPYMEQISRPNVCVYNIAWNGTKYNDLVNPATSSTNYLFPQAACVNQTIVKDVMGVNDIYANGANGPTINAYRTNLCAFCHSLGFQYWPSTLWDVGTNALSSNGGGYTWSATSSSNMYVANFLTVSNAWMYDRVARLDYKIAPNQVLTNTAWSLYGQQMDGPNGFQGNQIICTEEENPSTVVTTNYGAVFVPFVLP